MKSQSDQKQNLVKSLQGGLIISWNHVQKQREDMQGVQTYWECDQVKIDGMPSKRNIIAAIVQEKQTERLAEVSSTLAAFKFNQEQELAQQETLWKEANPYPTSDSMEQTPEQRAWWLMLVAFQDEVKAQQLIAYEAKEAELNTPVDYTQEATQVAVEVINYLNE